MDAQKGRRPMQILKKGKQVDVWEIEREYLFDVSNYDIIEEDEIIKKKDKIHSTF